MNIKRLFIGIYSFTLVVSLLFWLPSFHLMAEDVIEDLQDSTTMEQEVDTSAYPTEVITRISPTRKIMLLTDNNNSFQEGDYLSLILQKKLMIRVLCAKLVKGVCGVKLIKIYDDILWKDIRNNTEVQVLRGDDTEFKNAQTKRDNPKDDLAALEDSIEDTEFGDENSLEIRDSKKRILKNDNVMGLSYGLLDGVDNDGEPHRYGHWHVQWAYQIADNIWAEAMVGQAVIGQFPSDTLTTQVTSGTFRIKYAIKAPMYSIILPYLGYQQVSATSPDAGDENASSAAAAEKELENLDAMKKSQLIFGVTILKRIVPGWFLRADLGTDFLSAGLSLEF